MMLTVWDIMDSSPQLQETGAQYVDHWDRLLRTLRGSRCSFGSMDGNVAVSCSILDWNSKILSKTWCIQVAEDWVDSELTSTPEAWLVISIRTGMTSRTSFYQRNRLDAALVHSHDGHLSQLPSFTITDIELLCSTVYIRYWISNVWLVEIAPHIR